MRGVSRASFAELSEQLSAEHITSAAVATRLASELFAVVGLLDTEHGLRRALSDPGKPAAEKGAVAAVPSISSSPIWTESPPTTAGSMTTVSYTHLTLPTILLV